MASSSIWLLLNKCGLVIVFLVPATSVASIVVAAVVTSDTSVDYTVVVDALVVSSEEIVSVAFVVGSSFVTMTSTASVVEVAFGMV